jgi:ribosomal protein S18 acetylase RimI-like enzyme
LSSSSSPSSSLSASSAAAPVRRFAASEDLRAAEKVCALVARALADDPVTLAYALPGKERRYCEAALMAGLLADGAGRDRRLWVLLRGEKGEEDEDEAEPAAAAVAYLCLAKGSAVAAAAAAAAAAASRPSPPQLPLWASAKRAALTATALTSLKPGPPARACARAATALARVRGAYCAAVERSVVVGEGEGGGDGDGEAAFALVAYVSVLAVDPQKQGQGLGTALLRAVLRELLLPALVMEGESGSAAAPVAVAAHCYVEASSERSARLYARLGFRDVARVQASGDVQAGGGAGGEEEDGDLMLPAAPTIVMAAEVKGSFREWLVC